MYRYGPTSRELTIARQEAAIAAETQRKELEAIRERRELKASAKDIKEN